MPAKILVVDDDPDLRDTLNDWLVLEGHEVRVAADGLEALEWASWDAFDLVVTDLKMPNLDGLGLLSRLKDLDSDVQVIFLSGEATKSDVIEAMREGRSFDFLEKPLSELAVLSRAIARALARRPGRAVAEPPRPGTRHPVMGPVFSFIQAHLEEAISLREVAEAVGYSPGYLTQVVRQETGQPVTQWIAGIRMAKAKRLLSETTLPIAEIAQAVGIEDAGYFARQFRKHVGVAPGAWRDLTQ
ncbi:MAG: response regulator, partial [Candidatus Sericytochromatia bacterium]